MWPLTSNCLDPVWCVQGGGGGAGEWEQLEEEDDDTDQYIRTDEESKKLSVVWVRGRPIPLKRVMVACSTLCACPVCAQLF